MTLWATGGGRRAAGGRQEGGRRAAGLQPQRHHRDNPMNWKAASHLPLANSSDCLGDVIVAAIHMLCWSFQTIVNPMILDPWITICYIYNGCVSGNVQTIVNPNAVRPLYHPMLHIQWLCGRTRPNHCKSNGFRPLVHHMLHMHWFRWHSKSITTNRPQNVRKSHQNHWNLNGIHPKGAANPRFWPEMPTISVFWSICPRVSVFVRKL